MWGSVGNVAEVRPWNKDGHAIVDAAFTVDFVSPPTPSTVRELLALHSKVRNEYPRKQELTLGKFGISANQSTGEVRSGVVGETQPGGLIFDSLKANGEVERSIQLSENKLAITRADYEGWDKTWGEARGILVKMLPVLLERGDVIAIHLRYHDRFVWDGDPEEFRADLVFRRDSPFLAPNLFEVEDFWHSYHGFFEYLDRPYLHQLLNVMEAKVITAEIVGEDPSPRTVAEVRLNHRTFHGVEQAGTRPELITSEEELFGRGDEPGLLDAYMNEMHDRNKAVLRRLINDEMCDSINLGRPG